MRTVLTSSVLLFPWHPSTGRMTTTQHFQVLIRELGELLSEPHSDLAAGIVQKHGAAKLAVAATIQHGATKQYKTSCSKMWVFLHTSKLTVKIALHA